MLVTVGICLLLSRWLYPQCFSWSGEQILSVILIVFLCYVWYSTGHSLTSEPAGLSVKLHLVQVSVPVVMWGSDAYTSITELACCHSDCGPSGWMIPSQACTYFGPYIKRCNCLGCRAPPIVYYLFINKQSTMTASTVRGLKASNHVLFLIYKTKKCGSVNLFVNCKSNSSVDPEWSIVIILQLCVQWFV